MHAALEGFQGQEAFAGWRQAQRALPKSKRATRKISQVRSNLHSSTCMSHATAQRQDTISECLVGESLCIPHFIFS